MSTSARSSPRERALSPIDIVVKFTASSSPRDQSSRQRCSRIKYWVVFKLPNGDIRKVGHFIHFCKAGCCKSRNSFIKNLKWRVAIIAGRMYNIFPRPRWVGMDESILDGVFHNRIWDAAHYLFIVVHQGDWPQGPTHANWCARRRSK